MNGPHHEGTTADVARTSRCAGREVSFPVERIGVGEAIELLAERLAPVRRDVIASYLVAQFTRSLAAKTLPEAIHHGRLGVLSPSALRVTVCGSEVAADVGEPKEHVDMAAGDTAQRVGAWHAHFVDGPLEQVILAVRSAQRVAARTLWGNAAAAATEQMLILDWENPALNLRDATERLFQSEGLYRRHLRLHDHHFNGRVGLRYSRHHCCKQSQLHATGRCAGCPHRSDDEQVAAFSALLVRQGLRGNA